MNRTILHADMDAFYAAIEQRDHPEYQGKPVIVGGSGKRGVVATCSYEARRFGVHSAMPGAVAKRLCPEGIFVRPRMAAYVEASRLVREVFERFTDQIEPLSLDEAFLDVTGSRLAFGDGPAIAREIKRLVRERTRLTVSVGVAPNKFLAKVASDLEKPDGLTIVPTDGGAEFLAPLPISRLWGAGKRSQERFEQWRLRSIGDVARCEEESLVRIFGESAGRHYYFLSRGIDDRPVVSSRDPKSVSNEVTFGDDLAGEEACHAVLLELSESVGRRLRSQGLVGSVVQIKVRFPPFETHTRQQKLQCPSADDLLIYRTALSLLPGLPDAERPKRLLGVGLSELVREEESRQQGLFGQEQRERQKNVLRAMDRIRERFGKGSIHHGRNED